MLHELGIAKLPLCPHSNVVLNTPKTLWEPCSSRMLHVRRDGSFPRSGRLSRQVLRWVGEGSSEERHISGCKPLALC